MPMSQTGSPRGGPIPKHNKEQFELTTWLVALRSHHHLKDKMPLALHI
jgi:hypothetical protein